MSEFTRAWHYKKCPRFFACLGIKGDDAPLPSSISIGQSDKHFAPRIYRGSRDSLTVLCRNTADWFGPH